jgi:hypothetical protein
MRLPCSISHGLDGPNRVEMSPFGILRQFPALPTFERCWNKANRY